MSKKTFEQNIVRNSSCKLYTYLLNIILSKMHVHICIRNSKPKKYAKHQNMVPVWNVTDSLMKYLLDRV